jgi:hypothetical protein
MSLTTSLALVPDLIERRPPTLQKPYRERKREKERKRDSVNENDADMQSCAITMKNLST